MSMHEYNGTDEINLDDEYAIVAELRRLAEAGDFDGELSLLRRLKAQADKRREAAGASY